MATRAILCRTNAPLYQTAAILSKLGTPFRLLTKDFSNELTSMMSTIYAGNYSGKISMQEVFDGCAKIAKKVNNSKDFVNINKLDAIDTIMNVASTMSGDISQTDLQDALDGLHRYDSGDGAVTLCTIHSSKGLEWDEVFVIRPDLLPHPCTYGASAEVRGTEDNLKYVAYTRAKNVLYLDTNVIANGQQLKLNVPTYVSSNIKVEDEGLSSDQKSILNYFNETSNDFIISARAGSGKTFILRKISEAYAKPAMYLAFNKHTAESASMGSNVASTTMHSFLLRAIRSELPGVKVDQYRVSNKARELSKKPITNRECFIVAKLVSAAKNRMVDTTSYVSNSKFLELVDVHFTSDKDKSSALELVQLAREVLESCVPNNQSLDYDDMLWWPAKFGIGVKYLNLPGLVLVDEVQDFNKCQQSLLEIFLNSNSRVVAVGDQNQAIYYFRGAGSNSFVSIKESVLDKGGTCLTMDQSFRTCDEILNVVRNNTVVEDIYSSKLGGYFLLGDEALAIIAGKLNIVGGSVVGERTKEVTSLNDTYSKVPS